MSLGHITEDGIATLVFSLPADADKARKAVATVPGQYSQKVRSDAIRAMRSSTPAGILYKIKGKRNKTIEHRASAPGQPPAVQSGRLWSSITTESRNNGMEHEAGPTVDYGKYLELGTKDMDAREFMGPALEQNIEPLTTAITRAIQRNMGAS